MTQTIYIKQPFDKEDESTWPKEEGFYIIRNKGGVSKEYRWENHKTVISIWDGRVDYWERPYEVDSNELKKLIG